MLEGCVLKVVVATNAVFFSFLADIGGVKCVSGGVLAKVETRVSPQDIGLA